MASCGSRAPIPNGLALLDLAKDWERQFKERGWIA
jgi:hypothetical protein